MGVPEGFVHETKASAPFHHMTIVPFSPIVRSKRKARFSADYPTGTTSLQVIHWF